MSELQHTPEPMSRDGLADLLEEVAALVRAGDSFEGRITYEMPLMGPGLPEPEPDHFADVRAMWRVGNSMGQGGYHMVGKFEPAVVLPGEREEDNQT